MKTVLGVLGIVVAISLAAPGGLQVEASEDSAEYDAFVRAGFVALTGLSTEEAVAVTNGGGSKEKDKTFTVTCNGEPFNGTECIGQTIVNSTSVKSDDEVFYSVRYCNGKFTNTTLPEMVDNGNMGTFQICEGKTYLYMKTLKKCKKTGEWMKEYFYSKSCFSKYFLFVKRLPAPVGVNKIGVSTYCEEASETIDFFKKEKEGDESEKKGADEIPATCNCETSTMYEPCEGRFKIVMEVKPPSTTNGRKLTKKEGHSKEWKNKKWTFICDGKWIPYGKAFFECEGIKQEYKEMDFYNYQSSKNCTGLYGTGMFTEISGGYTFCNGVNSFEEIMTIPVVPPTT